MADATSSTDRVAPGASRTSARRPLILVRGFGGPDITAEQANAYQGFNDGTVYPHKLGENFIYEGFVLRALKSRAYRYDDATNVIGYYPGSGHPGETTGTVVFDEGVARAVLRDAGPGTIWVYRYYDLLPRDLPRYGQGLVELIRLIKRAYEQRDNPLPFEQVDIVAHSMGGLVVREALRQLYTGAAPGETPPSDAPDEARTLVHKVVTLGTPHRGIAFQWLPHWVLAVLPRLNQASEELDAFSPRRVDFNDVHTWFDLDRILTVVGTNHATYNRVSSGMNQLAAIADAGLTAPNRSDGLVQQASAQLPGAPRTFIHKCHGGYDGLVTSRESYEIAMRFFHGTHKVQLWLDQARVVGKLDAFGKPEIYVGVSIKPRGVDFSLFHQSPEAENCYGPFHQRDLRDQDLYNLRDELRKPLAEAGDRTRGWAGDDRLIWEGWVDENTAVGPTDLEDLVFRLRIYVGERDPGPHGASDDYIFLKDYYIQALPKTEEHPFQVLVHTGKDYLGPSTDISRTELLRVAQQTDDPDTPEQDMDFGPSPTVQAAAHEGTDWRFSVSGTQFNAVFRVRIQKA